MKLIDGTTLAEELLSQVKSGIESHKLKPRLDIIFVGDNPASMVYVNKKQEAGAKVGVEVKLHHFLKATDEEILSLCLELANNRDVHGIILQLPAPGIMSEKVFKLIPTHKDVDGLNPESLGLLWHNRPVLVPATARAVEVCLSFIARDAGLELGDFLSGKEILIISRSLIIGKPLMALFTNYDATVTLAHSKTAALESHLKTADIVISGAGSPGLITAEGLKQGAVVIDASFVKSGTKVAGDVGGNDLSAAASWLSPVPNGIGPLGVACLIENTYKAALLGSD